MNFNKVEKALFALMFLILCACLLTTMDHLQSTLVSYLISLTQPPVANTRLFTLMSNEWINSTKYFSLSSSCLIDIMVGFRSDDTFKKLFFNKPVNN